MLLKFGGIGEGDGVWIGEPALGVRLPGVEDGDMTMGRDDNGIPDGGGVEVINGVDVLIPVANGRGRRGLTVEIWSRGLNGRGRIGLASCIVCGGLSGIPTGLLGNIFEGVCN